MHFLSRRSVVPCIPFCRNETDGWYTSVRLVFLRVAVEVLMTSCITLYLSKFPSTHTSLNANMQTGAKCHVHNTFSFLFLKKTDLQGQESFYVRRTKLRHSLALVFHHSHVGFALAVPVETVEAPEFSLFILVRIMADSRANNMSVAQLHMQCCCS